MTVGVDPAIFSFIFSSDIQAPCAYPIVSEPDVRMEPNFFFSIAYIAFALMFSLPPSRKSDPGSHSRLFSPPYTLRFVPCIFIATIFQLLPSSTRVELCLPTLGALSS